jgi:hypothetical protein
MQSQSILLLAEVRHNEAQAEAARLWIVNQACARGAAPNEVVASAWGRLGTAFANAATRLVHAHAHAQGVLATARGNGSPAVSGLGPDTL